MVNREQARDIDDAACDWATKALRDLSPSEQEELDAWLTGDPRRLGAFVRAQAAWIHSERATALGSMPGPAGTQGAEALDFTGGETRGPSRRALIMGAGALAASVVGGVLILDRPNTIQTGVGELRQLTLAGGSTLTLDTDTRVKIATGSRDRRLELVHGKVFLNILSAGRPLTLSVGGLAMEMAWGAFGLEALGQAPVEAFVTSGQLAISQARGLWGRSQAITIPANRTFTLPVGANLMMAAIRSINSDDVDKLLAWRDGMLSFGDEALATAVRAFDRYGPIRIVIADPQLAQQKITGLFKANDPNGFATAIASSFGAAVVRDGNVLKIFIKK
jgi:transmembrane sensor